MVYCRCGCNFQNSRDNAFVTCPKCNRNYSNEAPTLYQPKTLEELRWICKQCGTLNEYYDGSSLRLSCANCGTNKYERREKDIENVKKTKVPAHKIVLIITAVCFLIDALSMFFMYVHGSNELMPIMMLSGVMCAGGLVAGAYLAGKVKKDSIRSVEEKYSSNIYMVRMGRPTELFETIYIERKDGEYYYTARSGSYTSTLGCAEEKIPSKFILYNKVDEENLLVYIANKHAFMATMSKYRQTKLHPNLTTEEFKEIVRAEKLDKYASIKLDTEEYVCAVSGGMGGIYATKGENGYHVQEIKECGKIVKNYECKTMGAIYKAVIDFLRDEYSF